MARPISQDEVLVRAFDTGKADERFVRCDWETMRSLREPSRYEEADPEAYRAGYLLGFFSDYANHMIGPKHRDEIRRVYEEWNSRMRLAGIQQACRR